MKIDNPSLYPAWVYLEPPENFDAPKLRGGPCFDVLEEVGIRVQRIKPSPADADVVQMHRVAIYLPWTFLFMPVLVGDMSSTLDMLSEIRGCSVIMDCHFPVMSPNDLVGPDSDLVRDNRDTILNNLSLADAVTVSQPQWAADLVGEVPNVYYLPDFTVKRRWLPWRKASETGRAFNAFFPKLMDVALASRANKLRQL